MNIKKLSRKQIEGDTWRHVREQIEARIEHYRNKNENPNVQDRDAHGYRACLQELNMLLTMEKEAPKHVPASAAEDP